jgi:plasmid segregation protein ParM
VNIGIDIGYGYTKAVGDNGKKVMFPSLVSRGYDRRLADIWGGSKDPLDLLHIKIVDGTDYGEYFVGKLAEKQTSAAFVLADNKLNMDDTRVLLATGLALVSADDTPVSIVTGLPLEQYVHQRTQFSQMLKGYKAVLTFINDGTSRVVEVSDAIIFPQAAGAIYSVIMDDPDKYLLENSYVGLIDIGYKTTDFVAFSVNDTFSLEVELSGTIDIGMSKVLEAVDKLYTQKTGGSKLDTVDLLNLSRKGRIFYMNDYLDITDDLTAVRAEIAKAVQNRVRGVWGDKLNLFNTIFISGGGGIDLYPMFRTFHPRVALMNDAQMANANGFLRIAVENSSKI